MDAFTEVAIEAIAMLQLDITMMQVISFSYHIYLETYTVGID